MKIKLTATNTIWVNCKKWNQLDYQNNHDCGIFAFHYHSRNDFDGAHSFWIFGGSQMAQSLFEYLCTLIFSSWIYDMWENIIDTHLMILGIVELVIWPDRKFSSYKDIRNCLRSNHEDLFLQIRRLIVWKALHYMSYCCCLCARHAFEMSTNDVNDYNVRNGFIY